MKQDNEQSCIIESSFLRGNLQEDQFESLCKKCQLEWLTTKCQSGNPILTICVNEECQNGIFDCNIFTCKCAEKHKVCKTVKVTAFSDFLNQMTQYQKSFFKKLYLIDEELIQKIKKSQKAVVKMISSGSLDEKSVQGLQIITAQKGSQNFHGKQADQLYNKLRIKAREKNIKQIQLEKLFSHRSNQMIDTNINLKTLIFQHFLKGSIPTVPQIPKPNYFINSPLINICINELYMSTLAFYQKKTYSNYGYLQYPDKQKMEFEKKQMDYLKSNLGNPISSTLLFRASQHNFQAAKFHQKCDNKGNTLTIIRTTFRKTIFAFAVQAWHSNGAYVNDTTNKSCIIWLDPQQKLTLSNTTQSIYCNASYGPTFGAHDIYIANGSANGVTGSTSFPISYNNGRGAQSQTNYTSMTGNPSGNGLTIVQYEVYQLNF